MVKEDVLKAYEQEKSDILEAFPSLTEDWSYFNSIEAAVEGYYTDIADVSESMRAVVRGMVVYLSRAELKYSKDEELGIDYSNTLPDNDIAGKLYKWECLKNLADKVKFTVPATVENDDMIAFIGDAAYEKIVDAEQPELDAVIAEINSARAGEKEKLDALAESYWQGSSKTDFICLLESRGEVISTPNKEDIVKKIYVDNGIMEQVKDFDVYVPTYLR